MTAVRPLTTTTELLVALRERSDDDAWRQFVDRYNPLLVALARRLGLDIEDAMDAAQQTLLEFLRDFRSGAFDRGRGRLRHWIMGIAQHRVRDLQRLRLRHKGVGMDEASAPPDPQRLTLLWDEEQHRLILEQALTLLRTCTRMTPRTVQAFELTALRQMPVEAAAKECGMSVSEVYVARTRATKRLRALVQQVEEAWRADG